MGEKEKKTCGTARDMSQDGRRVWLTGKLLEESREYRGLAVPETREGQWQLLRALMNVRPPMPVTPEFLRVQDAYLSKEVLDRGIVDAGTLKPSGLDGRLSLWQGDITRLNVDAIVNAANSALLGCFIPGHSCIDNIIHTYAGVQLRLKCHEIMQAQGHEEPTGCAKITPGYNLPCKYILHTVGPVITGPVGRRDCELLAACYRSCLELAAEHGIRSVAFCCISTGVFHFPQDLAARTAVDTVMEFLGQDRAVGQVVFNVFTDRDLEIYRGLLEN